MTKRRPLRFDSQSPSQRMLAFASSYRLAAAVLFLLALLTLLGTLNQTEESLYDTQKKYFESIWVRDWVGHFPVFLPGGALLMGILFVNLALGTVMRIRRSWGNAGLYTSHIGILILIVSAFVTNRFAWEGNMTLYPGMESDEALSYNFWQLEIIPMDASGKAKEALVIPNRDLRHVPGTGRTFVSKELPFKVVVEQYYGNSLPVPASAPVAKQGGRPIDGYVLVERPPAKDGEGNFAGLYARFVPLSGPEPSREAILHAPISVPLKGSVVLAFSPDGQTLASGSGSWDNSVKLWEVSTGKVTARLKGHSGGVNCVAFSPDGKLLASASEDHTLVLWDISAQREKARLKGHSGAVNCVAFSPDGRLLTSGSEDATVKLWDIATGKETASLKGHTAPVRSVAFAPDGKTLASSSTDKTVMLWDVVTSTAKATLKGHEDAVTCVAFRPDGQTLASGSKDATVRFWELPSGAQKACLRAHSGSVTGLSFNQDGKTLASASADETVRLWDVAKAEEKSTLPVRSGDVFSVAFNPRDNSLATASADRMLKLWDAATGKEKATLPGHLEFTEPVPYTFSLGGRQFAAQLVRERLKIPFTVKLDEFIFQRYGGSRTAMNYQSNITKLEGGTSEKIVIKMNEPLRHHGYTFFQSSYGPSSAGATEKLFTVFAVVKNPSDHWPLASLFVVLAGLLFHLILKLVEHLNFTSGHARKPAPARS